MIGNIKMTPEELEDVTPTITIEELMEMGEGLRGMVYDSLDEWERKAIAKQGGFPEWSLIPSRRDTDDDD